MTNKNIMGFGGMGDSERFSSPELPHGNLSFGISHGEIMGMGVPAFQFNADRFRHTLIVGRTGSGKSNHVQQMEREDIRNGAGVFVLAAHEEDALYPLACVPEERYDDVVFLDATNTMHLARMNPLDVDLQDPIAVDCAISDTIELLKGNNPHSFAGPLFEHIARMCLGLILQPTFPFPREIAEMGRLLVDPNRVKKALAWCEDEQIYRQWLQEAESRSSRDHSEVVQWAMAKVTRFSNDRTLRHFFGAGKSTIDIDEIVDSGKVFVACVPAERIGADAAETIGRWLVMRLKRAILRRRPASPWAGLNYGLYEDSEEDAAVPELAPFFVYVDEFSRFASQDFSSLLAESRKFNVGFVLSCQTLSQMRVFDFRTEREGDLLESVLGNAGTMVCYPVGSPDVATIARQLDVAEEEVRAIERYRPLAQLCSDGEEAVPVTLEVPERPVPDNPAGPCDIADRMVWRGVWERRV